MAQQKIYAEEQVTYAIGVAFDVEPPCKVKDILRDLTPIEIPTDEEIWHESNQEKNLSKDYAFARGAEWMRDKILNK